jgi:hypothetical protein
MLLQAEEEKEGMTMTIWFRRLSSFVERLSMSFASNSSFCRAAMARRSARGAPIFVFFLARER